MKKYFEFENRAKIDCGQDAAHMLGVELARFDAKKPFVLCSIDVIRSGICDRALSSLDGGRKGTAICFDGVPSEIDEGIISEMRTVFEKEKCDAIVAIGGASVLDSAKVLKAFLSHKCENISSIEGLSRTTLSEIPMIFLPTELCAGAELNGEICKDGAYVSSPDFVPNILIIDREIAEKKPMRSFAEGAIYAFANAIEAFVGAEEDDPAEMYAAKAVDLLFKYTVAASEHAGDRDAATGVALASALAGVAYGNVPFGAAHALSEAIAERCGGSKESAMVLVLAASLEKLSDAGKKKLEKLFNSLNVETRRYDPKRGSDEQVQSSGETVTRNTIISSEAAKIVVDWIAALCEYAGVVSKISDTAIPRESFGDIAESAQGNRASVTGVRSISKEEFIEILNLAY